MITRKSYKTNKTLKEILFKSKEIMSNPDKIKEEFKYIYLDNEKTQYQVSNLG